MSDTNAVPAPSSTKALWLMVVVALLALVAGGGGAYVLLSKDAAASVTAQKPAQKLPAQYVKLDPPFVVNFEAKGLMRFLQVTVEIMARDPNTADMLKKHDPKIRNDLILLLGSQRYEDISTREGKEQLRADALQVVAEVINSEGGDGSLVEQLYFTSFVMQ
jgi:flagellar FliL protein